MYLLRSKHLFPETWCQKWDRPNRHRILKVNTSNTYSKHIPIIQAFNNNIVDRFKPRSMDWTSPGDLHKRFELFKQKCELTFTGPLDEVEEAKKARLLLLWVGDKGLDTYNTSTWTNEGDDLKIAPVMEALEAYTKPQRNEILARYQLECLKRETWLVWGKN